MGCIYGRSMPCSERSQGQVGRCGARGSEGTHTDDFPSLQLLARENPFLFLEGGGAGKKLYPHLSRKLQGEPSELLGPCGVAHEIRGPATSVQANGGGEPGPRKVKFLFKWRHLQQ